MTNVIVRRASDADVPVLARLIEASARALSRGYYSAAETDAAIRHVFGVNRSLIADETYFVACVQGQIAGCGGWSRRRTLYGGDQRPIGDEQLLDPKTDAARIRAFFVDATFARKGVGRSLFDECRKAAAADGFRTLELMSTLPGVPFYSALGFSEVEPVTDVLPDGTHLRFVRMRRQVRTGRAL